MERKIILKNTILIKLNSLIKSLHHEKYFGTKVQAIQYVNKIYNFIENISTHKKYNCINVKHGCLYCKLKMNRHTTYYITFDQDGDLYLIKNIFTNHESGYVNFIK
jgi:hypothetical protein